MATRSPAGAAAGSSPDGRSAPAAADVDRIHQAVREMMATGSPYTGAPSEPPRSPDGGGSTDGVRAGDANTGIRSLGELHEKLQARCNADPEVWARNVAKLHEELSSMQSAGVMLSREDLCSRLLDLCPLTPTQASSAARLLEKEQTRAASTAVVASPSSSMSSGGNLSSHRVSSMQSLGSGSKRDRNRSHYKRQRPSRLSVRGSQDSRSGRDLGVLLDNFSRTDVSSGAYHRPGAIESLLCYPSMGKDAGEDGTVGSTALPIDSTGFNAQDQARAVALLGRIIRQQQRRAITNFDLFGDYFNGNRSRRVSLVEFRNGLRRLGIEDFGLGGASELLFRCIDSAGGGHFNLRDLESAMKTYEEKRGRPRRLLSHREDILRKNFDRIANSPTQSSRQWASAKLYSRAFSGAGRDDEKDHDPRKLLAGLARTLKRRTLRDWDIFMMCDEDRNGSVTPMEFATGLHKLQFSYTPRQLKRLWEAIDLDHSGRIEFDELHLALEMADMMGEGTQPGSSPASSDHSRMPTMEETLAEEGIESAVGALNDSFGGSMAGKKASERAIERERDSVILQRSKKIRRRIPPARLKALLKRLKTSLSAWYNHDRKSFQNSHGVGRMQSSVNTIRTNDDAESSSTDERYRRSGIAQAVANLSTDLEFQTNGKESEKDDAESTNERDLKVSVPGSVEASSSAQAVSFTIARAKQQMRIMVPFTSKELQAFFVLGTLANGDDFMSLDDFDDLLDRIERELTLLLQHAERRAGSYSPSGGSSPSGTRHKSQSMDFTESSGAIEDVLDAKVSVIQKQQVAVQRKATISLSDLIQKMQHQMQRSMLFNVALFSGADFSERASARAIRLQLSLLGFHVSLNEASLLLDRFSEDAAGLHFALVARKLQTACYTSMDDTVKCAIQAADPDNTGFCPAHYFELIVRECVSLTILESNAMMQLLVINGDATSIPYRDVFCEDGKVVVRGEEKN